VTSPLATLMVGLLIGLIGGWIVRELLS